MGWHAQDQGDSWTRLGWDDEDGPDSAGSYADAGTRRRDPNVRGSRGRGWQVQWRHTPWWSTTSRVGGAAVRRPIGDEAEERNHLRPGLQALEAAQKAWKKAKTQHKGSPKR